MDKMKIIEDGSNIACFQRTKKEKAKFKNLMISRNYLKKLEKLYPIEWVLTVDASLRYDIDNKEALENSIKKGRIIQSPSKTEADAWFQQYYIKHPEHTLIISNDNFKDHSIPSSITFKFNILFDEFYTIPDLEEYLKSRYQKKQEVKINV